MGFKKLSTTARVLKLLWVLNLTKARSKYSQRQTEPLQLLCMFFRFSEICDITDTA